MRNYLSRIGFAAAESGFVIGDFQARSCNFAGPLYKIPHERKESPDERQ
jgi:hypothetical protein